MTLLLIEASDRHKSDLFRRLRALNAFSKSFVHKVTRQIRSSLDQSNSTESEVENLCRNFSFLSPGQHERVIIRYLVWNPAFRFMTSQIDSTYQQLHQCWDFKSNRNEFIERFVETKRAFLILQQYFPFSVREDVDMMRLLGHWRPDVYGSLVLRRIYNNLEKSFSSTTEATEYLLHILEKRRLLDFEDTFNSFRDRMCLKCMSRYEIFVTKEMTGSISDWLQFHDCLKLIESSTWHHANVPQLLIDRYDRLKNTCKCRMKSELARLLANIETFKEIRNIPRVLRTSPSNGYVTNAFDNIEQHLSVVKDKVGSDLASDLLKQSIELMAEAMNTQCISTYESVNSVDRGLEQLKRKPKRVREGNANSYTSKLLNQLEIDIKLFREKCKHIMPSAQPDALCDIERIVEKRN
ncbi:hypothetical protein ACOME3_004965 [Neoechinorhynchus agilis]